MRLFAFDDDECEALAERFGTPCFVYRGETAERELVRLRAALPERVRLAYAVKANPHKDLLRRFAQLGASFDCASWGELLRVRKLHLPGRRIFLAGPGKSEAELRLAVELGARVQAEGWEDLERLNRIADRPVEVNLRVHPRLGGQEEISLIGGDAPSAFGVDEDDLPELIARARPLRRVLLRGLHVFTATNQLDADQLLAVYGRVFQLARRLRSEFTLHLNQVDLGGGLGVPYAQGERPLDLDRLGGGLEELLERHSDFTGEVVIEPGRFLAASSGIYLARIVRVKRSRGVRFAILEGGINHLMRPLLTGQPFPVRAVGKRGAEEPATLAGPLCTALDRLGECLLPELQAGDILAFGMAGAYGRTEAMSDFLSHPAAREVWIGESVERALEESGPAPVRWAARGQEA
jgi:diaminopimelate decarboxylase